MAPQKGLMSSKIFKKKLTTFQRKGGLCPGVGPCLGAPHTVKSMLYASYWNAFLLTLLSINSFIISVSNIEAPVEPVPSLDESLYSVVYKHCASSINKRAKSGVGARMLSNIERITREEATGPAFRHVPVHQYLNPLQN